jgi:hypothetical protein
VPTYHWRVDDAGIELIDRGTLGVTLRVGGQDRPIPPMTLGAWPLGLPGRQVTLVARRNLDVLRYQLETDGHLVPRHRAPVARPASGPPSQPTCPRDGAATVASCARCAAACCRACVPDGVHCASCLAALAEGERAAIARLRRIGVAVSLGLAAAILGLAAALRSPTLGGLGALTLALVVYLVVAGWLRERAERQAGRPPAIDR